MNNNLLFRLFFSTIALMGGLTSCNLLEEDWDCENLTPQISSYFIGETFGLYVVNDGNVVVETNLKVTTDGGKIQTEKDIYWKDGYQYFLYFPYLSDPKGMPEVGTKTDAENPLDFFEGLTDQCVEIFRVAKGERRSCNHCTITFQMRNYNDL